jgi:hypothetical protein
MLPVIEPDCISTSHHMVIYAAALLLFSAAPTALGMILNPVDDIFSPELRNSSLDNL